MNLNNWTVTDWLLVAVGLILLYCASRLSEIARSVEDIQDRLKHVHPVGPREIKQIQEEEDEDAQFSN